MATLVRPEHALNADVTDQSSPAANIAAIVQKNAVAGSKYRVYKLLWSYNAAPTSGRLYLQFANRVVRDVHVTAAGPGFIPFCPPLDAAVGEAVAATLVAAGASVTGRLAMDVELLDEGYGDDTR